MSYIGIPPFGNTVRSVTNVTATASQTTFNITGGYVIGYVDVFLNGVLLTPSDYTATDGLTVVLNTGASASDEFQAVSYQPVSIANVLPITGGTVSGDVTIASGNTLKTNTILDASGGNTVTINSVTPTAYNTMGKNRIINGNFDVWQRGSSFTITASTNTYSADRWRFVGSAFTGTLTRQSFTVGQTDVPSNPDYFARWDVTTNPAGNIAFSQYIENVQTLAGKTATVSFYLKSNSTIAANTLNLRYRQVTGGTGGATGLENIGEITTSWQKFTFTINIPSLSGATLGASNSSYLGIEILSPTAHTSAFQLDIAQVQVEEGSVATEFERRPYGTELALCQRYYQHLGGETAYQNLFSVTFFNANAAYGPFMYQGQMRAAPSISLSGSVVHLGVGTFGTFNPDQISTKNAQLGFNSGSGGTAGYSATVRANNDTTVRLTLNAEL